MKLEIKTQNYKMSDRLEEILRTKLNKLDKYFPTSETPLKVVLNGDGKRCRMEISINYYGAMLRSEVSGDTMYYIVDTILPKLERQIIKHRGKLDARHKMPAITKDEYTFVSDVVDEKPSEIAKVKKFEIQAIEVKEAVENLEMVDHEFYVFVNSATNNVEVVYRRKDGTVGLLQPYVK